MKSTLVYLLTAAHLATTSPIQDVPSPRGLGSTVHSAVSKLGNVVRSAAASAASSAVPELEGQSGENILPSIPPGPAWTRPLKNSALWQEAISFDAKNGVGGIENQNFYQLIASFQSMENSSNSYDWSASWIGRGLQYLHIYPLQFDKAQAGEEGAVVQLSPTPQQTITSFGASGAWWPNFLGDFPPAQQKNLSALLFSEDGLQLSGYRYNMGASGDKDNTTVSTPGRGVESFLNTDGSYDWQRDGPGVYYLKAAQDAGVGSITFFVNAMPSNLTSDNITTTKTTPCGSSLSAEQIPRFVEYITTVLAHMVEVGIKMEYISPMNEPDNSFSSCTQEGMSVPTSNRAAVFQQLRASLQASTTPGVSTVKIMGDETSQITSQALREYEDWLPAVLQAKSIDAIAAHMYDWPDDAMLLNYRQLVINNSLPNLPPPIKMTEISTFISAAGVYAPWGWTGPKIFGVEYDPSINSALDMARYIWQWLTLVNAESWDWWTAVSNMMPCSPSTTPGCASTYSNSQSPPGFNDGLVYIDPNYATTKDYSFYLPKRYWVFRHFTKFLRPGAVRYDVPNEVLPYGTVAVAGLNTDGVYSTIFVNRNATSQAIRMKLPAAGGKVTAGAQTTDKKDWENVPLPVVKADGTFRMTLPAKGVLSIQFTVKGPGVAPSSRRRRSLDGYENQNGGEARQDEMEYDELLWH